MQSKHASMFPPPHQLRLGVQHKFKPVTGAYLSDLALENAVAHKGTPSPQVMASRAEESCGLSRRCCPTGHGIDD